jgi:chromosome segregation ATPase
MTLDQLKHTRRKLQGAAAATAQAVQRAQKDVDDEQFQVRECQRHVEDARDRATLDAAQAALDSAVKDHALALRRLSDRQGEHAHAEMRAHTAQAQVVDAVDKALGAEREAIAAQCIEIYEQLTRKIAALRAVVPDELNTPRHLVVELSSTVMQALNLVPAPDAIRVPVNQLQFGALGDAAAWGARLARMIADEATGEATAA